MTPEQLQATIDFAKLKARMREVGWIIQGAKKHCRRTQRTVNAIAPNMPPVVESIDWSRLYELKAEATALCMLRAACRGKVHAPEIDKRQRPGFAMPSLRYAVAHAVGESVLCAAQGGSRDELRDLVVERMAEHYAKRVELHPRASSAA